LIEEAPSAKKQKATEKNEVEVEKDKKCFLARTLLHFICFDYFKVLQASKIVRYYNYLWQPMSPITDVIIVTRPVTARDLRISFELLFQVIDAKMAIE